MTVSFVLDEQDDLDDLDDVATVPFYKRDLSFKRKPRQKKEREKKPFRSERVAKKERAPAEERLDDEANVPFYKRGLRYGARRRSSSSPSRRRRGADEAREAEAETAVAPELELGGGGGKNAGKLVGLKIGASQIAAARVTNGDSPQLLQAVSSPLEHGVVVGGELRDPGALADALREFFKRHNLPRRAFGSASPTTGSASARSTSSVSTMRSSSTTRSGSGPRRCCRSHSRTPSSTTT